jgi:uncharacterized protein YfaS (alpha-2-macroglobulin family)
MLTEMGIYRGSTKHIQLVLIDKDGNKVMVDVSNLQVDVYRPDGTLYASYNSGFDPRPDGSVFRSITIGPDQPTGIWRVVWRYVDIYGNTWVEEMPFVVSDPVR